MDDGPESSSAISATLNRDEIRGPFRGNITEEPATEFLDCNEGIPWSISMGKKFPTEIVLISAEMFTEIGLSTEMELSWG